MLDGTLFQERGPQYFEDCLVIYVFNLQNEE